MKRLFIILAGTFLFSSCTEELRQSDKGYIKVIAQASLPEDAETKAVLTETSDQHGNLKIEVSWNESGESFSAMTEASEEAVVFTQLEGDRFEGCIPSNWEAPFYAFYPHGTATKANSIPFDISLQSGKLETGAPYMFAISSSAEKYDFQHITALIKLMLKMPEEYEGAPSSIVVSGESIASKGVIDITGTSPAFVPETNSITLPTQIQAQGSYILYVYVNPMSASDESPNTIGIILTDESATYTGNLTTSATIEAGKVYTASVSLLKQSSELKLADPSQLYIEQTSATKVLFSWQDNADAETGYMIYKLEPEDAILNTAECPANTTEYNSTVIPGRVYNFGIQARSSVEAEHSARVNFGEYTARTWAELQTYNADIHPITGENLGNTTGVWRECGAPQNVKWTQSDNTSGTLSWSCWSSAETGFNIYVRKSSESEWKESHLWREDVGIDATSATVRGLTAGESYIFGVQTRGKTMARSSGIIETGPHKLSITESVGASISNIESTYAYIAVDYTVKGISNTSVEKGLWISTSSDDPYSSTDGAKLKGPAALTAKQLIPASRLDPSTSYYVRAYVWDSSLDKYAYSEPKTIQLETQPEAITLSWSEDTYSSLPSSVSVYKTISTMNDRPFNAWYAIADPAEVDFRVIYPETVGSKKTVASQAEEAEDCYVLINGAIFGSYNIGAIFTEGTMTQEWHGEIEGCFWATDSNLYNITRAIIGVDSEGNPGAYWVGVPSQGQFHYYTSPLTSVVGQAKYGIVNSTFPYAEVQWSPYYAISCGPMLIYDGKIMVDHTSSGGHYYTNYECWSETGVYYGNPDRTAVGITEDGKIILFVCDGRLETSKGAYLTELAKIMKGLGCRYAMNLDGGGSTGMWVKDVGMINHMDDSWRSVKSTCGFFAKK